MPDLSGGQSVSTGPGLLLPLNGRGNRLQDGVLQHRLDQNVSGKLTSFHARPLVVGGQENDRHTQGGQFSGDGNAVDGSTEVEMDPGYETGGYARVLLSRKLVAGAGHDGGRWSCGDLWAEENVVSEVVEAPDQVGRGARPCLLIQERLSKFLEGNGLGEHMKHRHNDLVRDGHGGPQRASACLQPVVLVLVVAALGSGGADRGLNEGRLEVDVALAGGRALLLSGALVIARTDASPR